MSHREYEEIISTNQWSTTPDAMAGKWFAESYLDAKAWGNKINGSGLKSMLR